MPENYKLKVQEHEKRMLKLDNVLKIAIAPGNGDANEYMRGMANGLLLAKSIFDDKEPNFLTGPTIKQ